jgi:hypothetical protein
MRLQPCAVGLPCYVVVADNAVVSLELPPRLQHADVGVAIFAYKHDRIAKGSSLRSLNH